MFKLQAAPSITLIMFMGPKTLVLKTFCISSQVVSSRAVLIRIPALLTSRLSPSLPNRALTCWVHSFMLQRSEISDRDCQREIEQQSFKLIITLCNTQSRG